ncbi:MAG: hypothetical protein JWM43_1487 [Acidobacteriaceae bacterium]|nr:hypothetical protein [Acidobacteriaceae bacterium]
MAGYPPPYPPPPPSGQDWKYQRRVLREQARAQRDMIRAQRDAYRAQMRGMRRGSIVGPILVVALGVLFLLVQLGRISFYRVGVYFGRFWPLLLVAIGVVLVIEWAIDRNSNKDNAAYGRPMIGGGVVFLIVLIAIAGIGFHGFNEGQRDFFAHGFGMGITPENMDQFFGDKHESDQSLDQAFPANATLNVTNPRGDVSVSGTSTDNQIHIMVHKQVYTRSDSDAENRANELTPRLNVPSGSNGGAFDVIMPALEGAHADLVITLPTSAPVTISANHGDVRASTIAAPLNVTANHGDIEVSAIKGPVSARINNSGSSFSAHSIDGSLSVDGRGRDLTISDIAGPVSIGGDFFGSTHVEHIRGTVRFHSSRTDFQLASLSGEINISSSDISADGAQGPVSLTTRSRNINLEHVAGDLNVTNSNGSVDLISAPPLGNVTVQNRHGSVNVTVPEKASFTVQAETSNGDIENDFSLSSQENNSRRSLGGTVGKGGTLIRINTSEGDIGIKKANLAHLPPLPPLPPSAPDKSERLNITGEDGSSVYIGKDGVKIISGSDGSKVIIGKDGLNIRAGADGSSVYRAPDGTYLTENVDGSKVYSASKGTRLTSNADGSIVYVGANGSRYNKNADGSVTYSGSNGTRISVGADGRQTAIGPSGRTLSDNEVRDQLRKADDEIRKTEQQIDKVRHTRDAERNKSRSSKDN